MSMYKTWDTLSVEQYKCVDKIKKQLRKGNWKYLSDHPEIRAILRVFLHKMINDKPDDFLEFALNLFDNDRTPFLNTMINQQLKCVKRILKKSEWSEYDGERFNKSSSSHSLESKSSLEEDVNTMLSYALVLREREKDLN